MPGCVARLATVITLLSALALGAAPAQAEPAIAMSPQSAQILQSMLTTADATRGADRARRADAISASFMGTPYGADTLIGSANRPEQLVVNLSAVDCFTYADYVEALKRASNRDEFVQRLTQVRYKSGVVSFETRKHFFTDWAAAAPAVATDVTATLSAAAVDAPKRLNAKDSGGVYLPGLPVTARTVTYIPSAQVDSGVIAGLRDGDYIGAYARDGGLDVTHVGIYVDSPEGPVFRHASSLSSDRKVVDTPLDGYLQTVPGIVVLRPVA